MELNKILIAVSVLCYNFASVVASDGDVSPVYIGCVKNCSTRNCMFLLDDTTFRMNASAAQDRWARLLRWGCKEECRYHCMWHTVAIFQELGYPTPKFHGKWPFVRLYGIQEPASAISSALNLIVHVYMYLQLATDKRFSFKNTPLLLFWHVFFYVCAHAWLWSTIFHTRDTPFTEFMDYACALSMVMMLFAAAVVRMLYHKRKAAVLILFVALLYFAEHVRYLYSGRIDYDYNMTVNVIIGMVGTGLWMLYSLGALCGAARAGGAGGAGGGRGVGERRYVWRLVVFCKLSGAAVLLELFDFPPHYNAWDAHALWHLSTAPLPLLFYRFVIDDLDYLQNQLTEKKTDYKLA